MDRTAFLLGGKEGGYYLHELRRQLHRIPFDAADARGGGVRYLREHVLQAVPRLVEQRRHLAEGHERRLVADGGGAVARQVRDRLPVQHLRGRAHARAREVRSIGSAC